MWKKKTNQKNLAVQLYHEMFDLQQYHLILYLLTLLSFYLTIFDIFFYFIIIAFWYWLNTLTKLCSVETNTNYFLLLLWEINTLYLFIYLVDIISSYFINFYFIFFYLFKHTIHQFNNFSYRKVSPRISMNLFESQ